MRKKYTWFIALGAPETFYQLSQRCYPFLLGIALSCLLVGLGAGLFWVPPDYQQGNAFRIIYIHVPAAFLSLLIYTVMFIASCGYLLWKMKVADVIATVSAPIGAMFTSVALLSGAIWGKPIWGTWWVWDARLTSELILLLLYLGYISLRQSLPRPAQQAHAAAILAVVGFVDVPIVHFSVQWWYTLHQPPSLSQLQMPTIAPVMLWPLMFACVGFFCSYLALVGFSAQTELLKREQHTRWAQCILKQG